MPTDKPNWKLILIVLLVVAVVAVGAAVLTAEHVSMEIVLALALIAVAGSFLLNWYVGGTLKKDGDNQSPDKPA